MRQYDVNIKLAEKTQQITNDLDSFKEESGRALFSVVEVLEIMNKITDYERRAQAASGKPIGFISTYII